MFECKETIQNKLYLNVKNHTEQVMCECKEIIQNKFCLNVNKSYRTSYVLM